MVEPIKMGTRVTRASQHGKYHQKIRRTKPDSDLEKIDQNLCGLRLRVVFFCFLTPFDVVGFALKSEKGNAPVKKEVHSSMILKVGRPTLPLRLQQDLPKVDGSR